MKIYSAQLKGTTTVATGSNVSLTGSFSGSIAGIDINATNQFTASTSTRLTNIEIISASNINRITSLETKSASVDISISNINAVTASNIARLSNLETKSSSVDISVTNINSFTASNGNTSLNLLTGSLATTGSNSFFGTQVFSGSVFIANDLIVQGSSSIQYISASSVSIGTNIVNLNTATPSVRYAGISVQDSGSSAGVTGSMLWDSLCNRWIYSNPSTIGYSGGMLISGPRNTGTIGNESPLTCNVIAKSGGGDHIYDSCIIDDGTTVCVNANLKGSGTITGTTIYASTTICSANGLLIGNGGATATTNYLPKFTGASTIGNSLIWDNGTNVGIGNTNTSYTLDVSGTGRFSGVLTLSSTISNGTYTYTLPSATGTLALTSALSGYLPLSGGTLTGALSGTSATFSSSVTATSLSINTSGQARTFTTFYGAGSDGNNIFIGGGGLSSGTGGGASYLGSYNTANGVSALQSNTTGYYNTANGVNALYYNTTGYNNTANGVSALAYNTTGYQNTANGFNALYSNTTGYNNTANGNNALYSNTTGNYNTANGVYALYYNTTGYQNTANGFGALYSNTTGISNTANGFYALYSNTTGYNNTANGVSALQSNTTGYYNTANGVNALLYNTTGNNNTANGFGALYSNTTGISNTANGFYALLSNTTGNQNTANGFQAGYGTGTNANTTGSNNIFIGNLSVGVSATESNRTWIGNSSTTSTWLAGNVLIGNTTDNLTGAKLQVTGAATFSSSVTATGLSLITAGSTAALIQGTGTTTYSSLSFQNTTTGYGYDIGFGGSASIAPNSFYIYGGSTANVKFLINSSGNVGIGTSTINEKLDVEGNLNLRNSNTYSTSLTRDIVYRSSTASFGVQPIANITFLTTGDAASALSFTTRNGAADYAERMRITSGGTRIFNNENGGTTNTFNVTPYSSGNALSNKVSTTAGWDHFYFQNPNGNVGSISTNGSNTTYATSSDYRLKEDLKDFYALSILSNINVYDFKWKADNSRSYGVIAHELAEVINYAVVGDKDAKTENDEIKAQGVDYSKLVPILVKAIQEQNELIQNLQEQINILAK